MATATATATATKSRKATPVVAFVDVKPTKKSGYVRKTETLWCVPGLHSFRRPKVRGVKPNHCTKH